MAISQPLHRHAAPAASHSVQAAPPTTRRRRQSRCKTGDDEDATNSPLISVSCLSLPAPPIHRSFTSPLRCKQTNTVLWMTLQFKLSIDKGRQCSLLGSPSTGQQQHRRRWAWAKVKRSPVPVYPPPPPTTTLLPLPPSGGHGRNIGSPFIVSLCCCFRIVVVV